MSTSTARCISIGNRNDNPAAWTDCAWNDPLHGAQTKDVVAVIRQQGSSGSLMAGLWRTGYAVAGCEKAGSCRVQYSAPPGDETILLLEGEVDVVNEESGEEYHLRSGDVIGLPSGVPVRWTSRAPGVK